MRLWAFVASCVLVLGGTSRGLAQQPTGPATLENLPTDEGVAPAKRPVAVDATAPTAANTLSSARIQGAVTRPKDGVQHPDLDKAWAEYAEQIETVAKAIEQAIEKGLNAAAASGDLDAALKWKTAGEQFQKDGQIPEVLDGPKPQGRPKPRPTKLETSPQSLVTEARARLAKAYEAVEKELVKSLDLEKAKQVRSERDWLSAAGDKPAAATLTVVIEAKTYKAQSPNAAPQRDGTGVAIRESPRWDNLTIPADSTLLWDVALPQDGDFFVHVLYASGEARPCDVSINGKVVARNVLGRNTGGFIRRHLRWETLGPLNIGPRSELAIDPQKHGPHLSRIVISTDRRQPDAEVIGLADQQEQGDPVVGRWQWFVNGVEGPGHEFLPDGRISDRSDCSWQLVDPTTRRYRFTWGKKFVDVMTLSQDGARLSGRNNNGQAIEGRRIGPLN
jgi:hypothetical protein